MISVVIPLYNKEASIAQSLKSVLSQEYDDFEVVIVDDGSTDGSVDVVEAINDPHIRLVKQENGGPSKARNTGVKNAKGEWIYFIDADDELLPGALEFFAQNIDKHKNADIFLGEAIICNRKGERKARTYTEGCIDNPFKEYDNVKCLLCERDGCTYEDLVHFSKLPYLTAALVHQIVSEIPNTYYLRGFENEEELGNIMEFKKGQYWGRKYFDDFNFVRFLMN